MLTFVEKKTKGILIEKLKESSFQNHTPLDKSLRKEKVQEKVVRVKEIWIGVLTYSRIRWAVGMAH